MSKVKSQISKLIYFIPLALIQLTRPSSALGNPIPIDPDDPRYQGLSDWTKQNHPELTQNQATVDSDTVTSQVAKTAESRPWIELIKFIGLLAFVILIEVGTAYLYLKKRKKSLSILWTVAWVNIISLPLAWILMASLAEISMNSLLIVLLVEFLVVVFESFFIYVFNFKHIKYLESIFLTIITNFVSLVIGGIILFLLA